MGVGMKIQMHNCQGHADSEFDTGDAVFTAVTGATDKGKSTVVRACKLVRDNPRGIESFIRNGQKDMSITFDAVQRIKKTGLNAYIVQGHQEPFKALNGAVPKQVEDALNLGEENIQDQHTAIFLLDQSSGKIAQKLSKLTDLEPTTKALKIIATKKRTSNTEITAFNKAIESVQNQLVLLEHADAMDKELSAIERKRVSIDRLQKKHTVLSNVYNNAVKAQKKVADMPNTDMLQPAKQLVVDYNVIQSDKSMETEIANCISTVQQLHQQLEFNPSKLLHRAVKIQAMREEETVLNNITVKYNRASYSLRKLEKKLTAAIAKKKELIGDTCPLCGGGVA